MNTIHVNHLVLKVMSTSLKINQKTPCAIFTEFFGHINALEVRIYRNGYAANFEVEYLTRVAGIVLTSDTAIDELNALVAELSKILNECAL